MNTPGTFQIHATDGAARTGVLQTAHGPVNTPIFMPVGIRIYMRLIVIFILYIQGKS